MKKERGSVFNMKAKIRIARLLQYLLFFIPVKKNRIMFYANNRKGYVCNKCSYGVVLVKTSGRIRTYLGHPFSGNLYDADRNYSRAPAKLKLFLNYFCAVVFFITNDMIDEALVKKKEDKSFLTTWHGGGAYKKSAKRNNKRR